MCASAQPWHQGLLSDAQAAAISRRLSHPRLRLDMSWDRADAVVLDADAVAKSLAWPGTPNRIPQQTVARLLALLAGHRPQPVAVVPTHGDWQPRNWLVDRGTVKVIDFGRFAWRPAVSDFCRLAAQQWQHDARLEEAFFDGYGGDPRTPQQWRMVALHEAIGTAVWAHQVGDVPFENQGHRMIADALALFERDR